MAKLSPAEVEAFRYTQHVARRTARRVFERLEAGVTEREVTAELRAEFAREGVRCWFHLPFAWFGERTCFKRFHTAQQFMPSDRKLQRNDAVILDVAPALDGFPSDHALCDIFGEDPEFDRMKAFNESFKQTVLDLLSRDRTASGLFELVNAQIQAGGYQVRHTKYPFQALGHRMERFALGDELAIGGPFQFPTFLMLAGELLKGKKPIINSHNRQEIEGIWSIEPHMGNGRIGTKFEEYLWVHADGAEWLL